MKKRSFPGTLYLHKNVIASLDCHVLVGGIVCPNENPTTVDNSLGKKSTCPVETCTCTDAFTNCEPIRI